MNHVLHLKNKDQVLSLKLAFILLPVVMLMTGFALGVLFSSNVTLQSSFSVISVIAAGTSSLIALVYGFTYYFKKIDNLLGKR